ncbi:hypothetical protein JB92DRAFT_2827893 [Gautieria morchelliformis]|nr:hypothetical protein JB92DRAFT_2827893 [Gautieria morchelliformis]
MILFAFPRATADSANAFRARGIPATFRTIETMGIQQARACGQAAEQLYHNIDNTGLCVGMQAEEPGSSVAGSELCLGFIMSRSILADAVALIWGDRFLTIEYTPFNLTSWGYQDVETTDDSGSLGYTPKSIYAHFPVIVPSRMRENIENAPGMIERLRICKENRHEYNKPYEVLAECLTDNHGFYFGASDSIKHRRTRGTIQSLLFTSTANSEHARYYCEMTRELFAEKSYAPARATTRTVDIVREVHGREDWLARQLQWLQLRTPNSF